MMKRLLILLVLAMLVLSAGSISVIEQKEKVTTEPTTEEPTVTVTPTTAPSPKYLTLKNGQNTETNAAKIRLTNGEVKITGNEKRESLSSTIKVNNKPFSPGMQKEENGNLTWGTGEKWLFVFDDPIVRMDYELTEESLKETITLKEDRELAFPITLPADHELVKLSNGDYRVTDTTSPDWWKGTIIKKPYGVDATGKHIEMDYRYTNGEFILEYDRSGIAYPLVIDPTYVFGGAVFNMVRPVKLYGAKNETIPVRWTLHNMYAPVAANTTTDWYLGGNIHYSFNDVRFATEDASTVLPAMLTAANNTMAEIYVSTPITTTGTVVNMFYNSSTAWGKDNWTTVPNVKTMVADAYYSVDEDRRYLYTGNDATEQTVSESFSDYFTVDTETRYGQLSATTGTNWVASAEGDVVVSGGDMTLASDDDKAVLARLKSYKQSGGVYEFSFTDNNDGGGGDSNITLWYAMQDTNNANRIELQNTTNGESRIVIQNISAGTTSDIALTYVNTSYTKGNKTWIKTKFEETNQSVWVWLRDDSIPYSTTPNLAVSNTRFDHGYLAISDSVNTAGAGNLNLDIHEIVTNAELYIGLTNVPDPINGGYVRMLRGAQVGEYYNGSATVPATRFTDDFNWDTIGEYTQVTGTHTIDTNFGILYNDNTNKLLRTNQKYGSGTIMSRYYSVGAASGFTKQILFGWGGSRSGDFPINAYSVQHSYGGAVSIGKWDSGGSFSSIASGTGNYGATNTPYSLVVTWDRATGIITANAYSVGGSLLSTASVTDTTYTDEGYVGFRDGVNIKTQNLNINALSADTTDGVAATLGGVPHGARYDTNEYAGVGWTDISGTDKFYKASYPSASTNATFNTAPMNLWYINGFGNSISNTTPATNHEAYNVGVGASTRTQPAWTYENLSSNSVLGTEYYTFINHTFWEGTAYDERKGTVIFMPSVAYSQFATGSGIIPEPVTGSVWANFTANTTGGVGPLAVAFNDTSEADPIYPITSWNWSFGDGNFSEIQHPIYTYVTSGFKTVTLTVNNTAESDSLTKTNYINVGLAPVSNFTGLPLSGNTPLAVTFTDTSTNTPTSWYWVFGDGNTSVLQNPVHTYDVAGSWNVSMFASNAAGSDWENKTYYVNTTTTTGFTDVPINMTAEYTLTIHVTDSDTGLPIPVVTIMDSDGQTVTTTTGTGVLTEGYGLVTGTLVSDGYYSRAFSVVVDEDMERTYQMTPLGDSNTPSSVYILQQVRFKFVGIDGYPISGLAVTATPLNFTAPSNWTEILLGINPAVNITGSSVNGITGDDGSWVAPMLPSIQYGIHMLRSDIDYTITLYPSQTEYTFTIPIGVIAIPTPASNVVSYSLQNVSVDATHQYFNMSYVDASGGTNALTFSVRNTSGIVLSSASYSGAAANNQVFSQLVTVSQGESYTFAFAANQSEYGWINQTDTVTLANQIALLDAAPGWVEEWIAIALIIIIASIFTLWSKPFALVGIPVAGWFFQHILGWLPSTFLSDIAFICMVALGILVYIRQKENAIQ